MTIHYTPLGLLIVTGWNFDPPWISRVPLTPQAGGAASDKSKCEEEQKSAQGLILCRRRLLADSSQSRPGDITSEAHNQKIDGPSKKRVRLGTGVIRQRINSKRINRLTAPLLLKS